MGGDLLLYSAKAMTPMTVAMMMFTALSLIESASMRASFNLRTADAIQSAAAVSVAPKASPETMDVAYGPRILRLTTPYTVHQPPAPSRKR